MDDVFTSGEGKCIGQLQAHHNHPGHPEEKNVQTSLQQLRNKLMCFRNSENEK